MASVHDHRWTEPDAPRWEMRSLDEEEFGRLPLRGTALAGLRPEPLRVSAIRRPSTGAGDAR